MPDTTLSTMDAVAALMQEREKYEGWISALEARRATTPPRVYERVTADYRARLDHVLAEIAGRASELESVSATLRSRVQVLQADEESRMEERAEAELRAAVGEYSAEQWDELRSVADAEIAHVSAQLGEQRAELDRVEQILAIARRPLAGAAPVEEPVAPAAPAAPVAAESDREPSRGSTGAGDGGLSIGVVRGTQTPAPDAGVAIPFAPDVAAAGEPEAREADPRRPTSDAGWSDTAGGDAAFDDLAFLKSIVEPTSAPAPTTSSPTPPSSSAIGSTRPIPRGEESRLSTPGRGLAALRSLLGADEKPAAAKGTPTGREEQRASAAGRDDGPAAGAKTLRCGECGTLNYPTEWYCERCGGELAAM
jgi:hypothetical protein